MAFFITNIGRGESLDPPNSIDKGRIANHLTNLGRHGTFSSRYSSGGFQPAFLNIGQDACATSILALQSRFQNHKNTIPVQMIVLAQFQAINREIISKALPDSCSFSCKGAATKPVSIHVAATKVMYNTLAGDMPRYIKPNPATTCPAMSGPTSQAIRRM